MRNIAIIPARSGSKGLRDKNIMPINDKPLLVYSIEEALRTKLFEVVMVSTDSEKYADIAREHGSEVPFLRSEDLSGDNIGSWEVVKEVLIKYKEQYDKEFDTVCLLQPTSPLRNSKDIMAAYGLLIEKKADSVTAVCEMEHSPKWSDVLPSDNSMKNFCASFRNSQRQSLDTYYRINGAIYIRSVKYSTHDIDIQNNNEYAYIMDKDRSIDIDDEYDFLIAQFLMRKRND